MGKKAMLEVSRMSTGALYDTLDTGLHKLLYEYGLNHYERDGLIYTLRNVVSELRVRGTQLSLTDPDTPRS